MINLRLVSSYYQQICNLKEWRTMRGSSLLDTFIWPMAFERDHIHERLYVVLEEQFPHV